MPAQWFGWQPERKNEILEALQQAAAFTRMRKQDTQKQAALDKDMRLRIVQLLLQVEPEGRGPLTEMFAKEDPELLEALQGARKVGPTAKPTYTPKSTSDLTGRLLSGTAKIGASFFDPGKPVSTPADVIKFLVAEGRHGKEALPKKEVVRIMRAMIAAGHISSEGVEEVIEGGEGVEVGIGATLRALEQERAKGAPEEEEPGVLKRWVSEQVDLLSYLPEALGKGLEKVGPLMGTVGPEGEPKLLTDFTRGIGMAISPTQERGLSREEMGEAFDVRTKKLFGEAPSMEDIGRIRRPVTLEEQRAYIKKYILGQEPSLKAKKKPKTSSFEELERRIQAGEFK